MTGTSRTPSVDLRRPWAVVTEWITDDPASERRRDGTRSCQGVSNPPRLQEGSLSADGRRWVGTSVDVVCDDGADFDFYRMSWTPGQFWLVTNQVATTAMGGVVTSWSTETAGGSTTMRPLANQQAVVTVCGHRGAHVDCFGGTTGWGAVITSTSGMATHASTS